MYKKLLNNNNNNNINKNYPGYVIDKKKKYIYIYI